jgi:hypothetical protein
MGKHKFEPYVWAIFSYKGSTAIGRTIYGEGREEMVSLVTDTGKLECIPFIEIEQPRKLGIVKKGTDQDNSVHFISGITGGEA